VFDESRFRAEDAGFTADVRQVGTGETGSQHAEVDRRFVIDDIGSDQCVGKVVREYPSRRLPRLAHLYDARSRSLHA
jgi:hypothetical protein